MTAIALPRTTFPIYEHTVRRKLEDLIARVFSPPFAKIFRPVFDPGAAAAIPWYLSGGIAAANCVAAYDAKNAASLAASYDNLASAATTYDCTAPVAAPTWAAGIGWTFNGSTQYLDTAIIPATGMSVIWRFTNAADLIKYDWGESTPGAYFLISLREETNKIGYYNGGGQLLVTPKLLSGVVGMSGATAYRNGVAESGSIPVWTSTTSRSIWLGGVNNLTATAWRVNTYIAWAIYNTVLDATTNLALYTAIAAL